MKTVKALVLTASAPKVAHSGQWQLLVLFPLKKFGRIYREKRIVFSDKYFPPHSWIIVDLICEGV